MPLYYQGHAYRAGSRIRVTIAAPGGDQPVWAFGDTRPEGHGDGRGGALADMPSRLVLPVVAGRRRADAAAALPGPARRAVPDLRAAGQRDGRALADVPRDVPNAGE